MGRHWATLSPALFLSPRVSVLCTTHLSSPTTPESQPWQSGLFVHSVTPCPGTRTVPGTWQRLVDIVRVELCAAVEGRQEVQLLTSALKKINRNTCKRRDWAARGGHGREAQGAEAPARGSFLGLQDSAPGVGAAGAFRRPGQAGRKTKACQTSQARVSLQAFFREPGPHTAECSLCVMRTVG